MGYCARAPAAGISYFIINAVGTSQPDRPTPPAAHCTILPCRQQQALQSTQQHHSGQLLATIRHRSAAPSPILPLAILPPGQRPLRRSRRLAARPPLFAPPISAQPLTPLLVNQTTKQVKLMGWAIGQAHHHLGSTTITQGPGSSKCSFSQLTTARPSRIYPTTTGFCRAGRLATPISTGWAGCCCRVRDLLQLAGYLQSPGTTDNNNNQHPGCCCHNTSIGSTNKPPPPPSTLASTHRDTSQAPEGCRCSNNNSPAPQHRQANKQQQQAQQQVRQVNTTTAGRVVDTTTASSLLHRPGTSSPAICYIQRTRRTAPPPPPPHWMVAVNRVIAGQASPTGCTTGRCRRIAPTGRTAAAIAPRHHRIAVAPHHPAQAPGAQDAVVVITSSSVPATDVSTRSATPAQTTVAPAGARRPHCGRRCRRTPTGPAHRSAQSPGSSHRSPGTRAPARSRQHRRRPRPPPGTTAAAVPPPPTVPSTHL